MRRFVIVVVVVALALLAPPAAGGAGAPDSTGLTTRVSVKTGGVQAEAQAPALAAQPSVSQNGQVVAFVSEATNLVPDDTNGVRDVFVNQNGAITRVSLGPGFREANGPSFEPAISSDGRFVAFASAADNLVPDDTNGAIDVFVYDRAESTVTRVSVAADGTEGDGDSRAPSIAQNGSVVVFTSAATNLVPGDTNGRTDVFAATFRTDRTLTLVSVAEGTTTPADGDSGEPAVSDDGSTVVFSSDAPDLVAGDENGKIDVFRRSLADGGPTEMVSLRDNSTTAEGNGDSYSPSVSADGSHVVFASDATNLVSSTDDNDATDVYHRTGQTTRLVSRSCGGDIGDDRSFAPRISSDTGGGTAGIVSFLSDATNLVQDCADSPAPDSNNVTDVFLRPLAGGSVEWVSRDPSGAAFPRPSLGLAVSGDRWSVAFVVGEDGAAGGDVFVRRRSTTPGTTTLVSAPPGGDALGPAVSDQPAISGDGRWVTFASAAPDLVSDDHNGVADVFVVDRTRLVTERLSRGLNGAEPNGASATDSPPAVSADGQVVAFSSLATNLVANDTNGLPDVFVVDRATGETTRVSVGPDGVEATSELADGGSYSPALSADGRYVAFASDADNLVPGDTNNATDVFIHDRQTGTTTRVSVTPGGQEANDLSYSPAISADGQVVAFLSLASNLAPDDNNGEVDVFIRDLAAGTTTAVRGLDGAAPDAAATALALSADGATVAFVSTATNLVPGAGGGTADVFVHDRRSGGLERVSRGLGGAAADGDSDRPSVSADGRFVAFSSGAANLVPADTNQRVDVFVFDRRLGTTTRVSVGPESVEADQDSHRPSLSADGRYVAFQSFATNLVDGDTNSAPDIFVHDRTPVRGYWLVAADGGIFAFGDAPFLGSTGATRLNRPILGMAPTPTGRGYWLVAADGGIFAFGDAPFLGSTGAMRLNRPIVGMAPTPTGRGYWLVASDGGIFAFGDAPFAGSTGSITLAQPIMGMAATPAGGGYWLVGSDGGIFAFGDARFFGSTGAMRLNQPIVGLAPSPTGGGYWMVATDGGIFAFGDATFFGSAGSTRLVRPVVGMAIP